MAEIQKRSKESEMDISGTGVVEHNVLASILCSDSTSQTGTR